MTTTPEAAELKPCREAFETWWSPLYDRSLERDGDGYSLMQTQLAWDAWKNSWNTRASTPPAAPVAEDAVGVLSVILARLFPLDGDWRQYGVRIAELLADNGYTIRRETTAPDGVAKQPEAQSAPAMTEAELEREALELAKDMFEWTDSANASFIVGLVKKYAGRV